MSDGQREPIESSLTPEEASRIIHAHRKVRYGMSPLPSACPLPRNRLASHAYLSACCESRRGSGAEYHI
jgi:hypothetical protein